MSILIKGMKMPTRCWDCPMCYDMIGCSLTGERWWSDSHVYLDFSPNEERMCNCPLIELPPHGDLIDREKIPFVEAEYACDDYAFRYDINEMTPVIPADPEGGADG